jgi:hypothetical protein
MKPLVIFPLLGAIVLAWLVVHGLQTGQVRFKSWLDVRSKSPFAFWSSIVLYSLTAFCFLLIAAKEAFFPN